MTLGRGRDEEQREPKLGVVFSQSRNRSRHDSSVANLILWIVIVTGASDWIIDIGPGAGDEGGRIAASGLPKDVAKER